MGLLAVICRTKRQINRHDSGALIVFNLSLSSEEIPIKLT